MTTPDLSAFHIRKWYLQIEDTHAGETGAPADGAPLRKIVIAACLKNPFAGRFEQDLSALIDPSPELGREFARRIREAAAGQPIESYGKACLVGIDGEYEHGNALLTNPAANPVREGIGGGKSWGPRPASAAAPAPCDRHSAGAQGRALCALALRHGHRALQRRPQPATSCWSSGPSPRAAA